jgi:hypothetical protein
MRKILSAMALAMVVSPAAAQCFDTAFGNPITTSQLFGDIVFPMQPIGFAFPLGGSTYSDIHVCDKGYVYLSNGGTPTPGFADFSATAAELASGPPRICALWSDIQVLSSNNGMVWTKSTPTTFTITWENAQCYSATSGLFNMQMVLSSSGTVKVLFGPGTTNASLATQPTWFVGVAGISPGAATLPAASDLSVGGSTVDNTVFEEWLTVNTFDMADNGLLYVPTSPTGWAFVSLGTPTGCAQTTVFGQGCVQQNSAIYEYFDLATNFDLANTTVTYLRSGTGYVALNSIPGTFVTPGAGAQIVANGDDIEQTVTFTGAMPIAGGTTSSLTICSNGHVAAGATGNGAGFTPDEATFLAWTVPGFAAAWHDYNPTITGSGSILYEQVGNTVYVTWNGVYSFGSTVPDTFQYQFDVASGTVTIVYGSFSLVGNGFLAGYKVGGSSVGGAVDLSTALNAAPAVFDVGSNGVALTTNSPPALGNATFAFVASDVPPVVPLAIMFFGSSAANPGIPLGFIGMPGCEAYTSADLGSASFPVAGGTGSVTLPIPNNPVFIGLAITAQAVAFSTATPAGLVSSNGVTATIGN